MGMSITKRGWWDRLAICLALIGLLGCQSDKAEDSPLALMPDSILLRSGDVVARHGNAWYSPLISARVSADGLYSHMGIVEYLPNERDSLWVWHMEMDDDRGHDGLVREPLASFVRHGSRYGLYRCSDMDPGLVLAYLRGAYAAGATFDQSFGDAHPKSYYCTELVALALNAGGTRGIKPSYRLGGELVYSIDDILSSCDLLYRSPRYLLSRDF